MRNTNVQYLLDERDSRRQARIERQRAARRAERRLLIEQTVTALIGFMALVIASGVLN